MDEDSSRDGYRRGFAKVGSGFMVGGLAVTGFGALVSTSLLGWLSVSSCSGISPSALDCWLLGSKGCLRSSESRRWCCSSRANVRRASMLVVLLAALENSPAARVCSLMATVVSADWVAIEAARAWSWA